MKNCFLVALMVVPSCYRGGIDLRARDQTVAMPTLQLSMPFLGEESQALPTGTDKPPEVPDQRRIRGQLALDFELTGGHSKDTQEVGNDFVEINDELLGGRLEIHTDLYLARAAIRGGLNLGGFAEIEGLGGLAAQRIHIEVESGSQSESDRAVFVGPHVGVRLTGHVFERLRVFGQYYANVGVGQGLAFLNDYQLGIHVDLHDRLALLAGWRWWDLEADPLNDIRDGVELRLSGPMAGMLLRF
jgi:hypothetical protein